MYHKNLVLKALKMTKLTEILMPKQNIVILPMRAMLYSVLQPVNFQRAEVQQILLCYPGRGLVER